jgi:glycerol uptake facilitator-like aquaporin
MALKRHKRYTAEFTGTFLFVAIIAVVVHTNPTYAPIAIGFTLMAVVFAFGYFSGGHFNPAVSFGVALIRGMTPKRAVTYMLVQVLGGILGAAYAILVTGDNTEKMPAPMPSSTSSTGIGRAIAAEALVTFFLVTVVLQVACSRQKNNQFYGFAIGMTVLAGAFAVGGVSGGAFNPAVSTGMQLVKCCAGHCEAFSYIWLYWLADMGGAFIAACYFLIIQESKAVHEWVGAQEGLESSKLDTSRLDIPMTENQS